MAPTLYLIEPSPPVRGVLITAKAIGVTFTEKTVDLSKGEHLTSEYLKINPQHTVPTLVEEDGFIIWDSHAIEAYLVSKYAKNDSLYPKDLKKRALVDQRLHFDSSVAFTPMIRIVGDILQRGKNKIDENDKESGEKVYEFLEAFLNGKEWIAGDSVTIADYSLYSTITTFNVLVPIDAKKYPKVTAWLKKVGARPEAEINPQHTVPTLVEEDGFIIWDSHAIEAYLVSKYAKNDSLYPKDLKKRALVDQRLHFDSCVAFTSMARIIGDIFQRGKNKIDENHTESGEKVYEFLEAFLNGKEWIAGDSVTIADYSLYSTITSLNVLVPIDAKKYPKLTAWLKKINPQHTVTTLVEEDGFIIWDSHAIEAYLVSKYAKNDSLYPKDLKKRALVDQRLHFDSSVAFTSMARIIGDIFQRGKNKIDENHTESGKKLYEFLEAFLNGKEWIVGDSVTIADYSLYSTITSLNVLIPIDAKKYPKKLGPDQKRKSLNP
ncbi:GST C domain containing protein [Asbolus verrucosus]|uniref:GST C domain containing protein n=1 Tax=Asbolus verrucosus TaxID=1661398 RepID=A0A482VSF1_ASBVE|nr:GST C domain containing protein [Asbolus verrucosus]